MRRAPRRISAELASMNIKVDESGDFPVVYVEGELGAIDAEDLADALVDKVGGKGSLLAVELSGLKSIDSSNLSVLINLATRARLAGASVVLVAPSPFVQGILEVTRLITWFDVCDSVSDVAVKFG